VSAAAVTVAFKFATEPVLSDCFHRPAAVTRYGHRGCRRPPAVGLTASGTEDTDVEGTTGSLSASAIACDSPGPGP
jgi:hypothetical protein